MREPAAGARSGRKAQVPCGAVPACTSVRKIVDGRPAAGTTLAFDFGERFTGVAVGESSVRVAHPLGLITAQSNAARMEAIAALVAEWKPGLLVVGLPLSMEGAEHELTRRCRRFAHQLESRFRLPVQLVDERLSSASAEEALRAAGKGGRKHKLHAHRLSAQIILQSHFDDSDSSRP
jgi:putative Holliday junction resolvase